MVALVFCSDMFHHCALHHRHRASLWKTQQENGRTVYNQAFMLYTWSQVQKVIQNLEYMSGDTTSAWQKVVWMD